MPQKDTYANKVAVMLPYSESSIFLVPLKDGGYARGVVARASPEGRGILGYFFGPRIPSKEDVPLNTPSPETSILRIIFGDLGLVDGKWPVIGTVANWNRAEWPMPDFVRRDPLGRRKPVLVRYSDTDPMQIEAEYPISEDAGLQPDALAGYESVEFKLSKLLY
jgi:hypothetical protein